MAPTNGPKNKSTEKTTEQEGEILKANRRDNKEELDNVPIDKDAQHYFDAQDEDQELNTDDNRDIPL
ncbi:MAG TPA: hypothetical protein VJ499_00810 [Flavisolibacter sp.]|nr:hypothetical protein [Flavisolibacter sp.]